MFGGYTDYEKHACKYDTLTDTYTRLTDTPYEFNNGSSTAIRTSIYLFGGLSDDGSSMHSLSCRYLTKNLKNKTIFIETKQLVFVKLTKMLLTYISNAKISTDEELLPYPAYYGNGKEWIKIEE